MGFQLSLKPIIDATEKEENNKTVQTKDMAAYLWSLLRHAVAIHHSSLKAETRRKAADDFRTGRKCVIVATIGFGMDRLYFLTHLDEELSLLRVLTYQTSVQ